MQSQNSVAFFVELYYNSTEQTRKAEIVMEENITPSHRPHRHRKTKMEIFKEATLPYLILILAAVIIIVFIVGALVRNANEKSETAQVSVNQIQQV